MTDRIIRIFLAICCIVLAISLIDRPRVLPTVEVSDNGIVPPGLLKSVVREDAMLGRPVGKLKLDNSQLDVAINSLSAAANVRIDVNWKALEGAGIDRAAPIHVHLHDGTLRQALNWVADDVGGGTTRLAYAVDGDTVAFSTAEDLSRDMTTETYNIRPLIEAIQRATPRKADDNPMTPEEANEMIAKLVTDTIAPDSWRSAGGTVGDIREIGGLLVFTQTWENQREIATLLTRLDAEMRK